MTIRHSLGAARNLRETWNSTIICYYIRQGTPKIDYRQISTNREGRSCVRHEASAGLAGCRLL
jgi:hypothetical protein